ncbi:MAG: hypothetical protein CVT48_01160 [Thermoplasmata archaeon HGW-Thermoplasmata-1]|nr:MAG: hypothetical protein CVT48_01160 [Thermoplasmata archaeon HGW-Thermoplasmata-1]
MNQRERRSLGKKLLKWTLSTIGHEGYFLTGREKGRYVRVHQTLPRSLHTELEAFAREEGKKYSTIVSELLKEAL